MLEEILTSSHAHVPQLLRQHLLLTWWQDHRQHQDNHNDVVVGPEYQRHPSLHRLHGVLLFVDISGFTILSQKLHVDALHQKINQYFGELLSIVDAYGGDVIKFAGDALFILWPTTTTTDLNSTNQPTGKIEEGLLSHNILQAIECAFQLILQCGDYHIEVNESQSYRSDIIRSMHRAQRYQLGNKSKSLELTNSIIQGNNLLDKPTNNHTGIDRLSIHCGLSVGHFYGLDVGCAHRWEYLLLGAPLQEVASAENDAHAGELVINAKVLEYLTSAHQQSAAALFSTEMLPSGNIKITRTMQEGNFLQRQPMTVSKKPLWAALQEDIHLILGTPQDKEVEIKLFAWLIQSFIENAHEVMQFYYRVLDVPTLYHCYLLIQKQQQRKQLEQGGVVPLLPPPEVAQWRDIDDASIAELREVVVLFIKIEPLARFDAILSVTSTECKDGDTKTALPFGFLPHQDPQQQRDDANILTWHQRCMEILVTSLAEFGGHLRQFIVDDKGTVGIGTFGMKSAVDEFVAARAIDCAKRIIDGLEGNQCKAGIGITLGKVYCGLVGWKPRHECVVLGSSVNLSARLMGKVDWGQVLCDENIKMRDKQHVFESQRSISAKGYQQQIPVFHPLYPTAPMMSASFSAFSSIKGQCKPTVAATSALSLLDRSSQTEAYQDLLRAHVLQCHSLPPQPVKSLMLTGDTGMGATCLLEYWYSMETAFRWEDDDEERGEKNHPTVLKYLITCYSTQKVMMPLQSFKPTLVQLLFEIASIEGLNMTFSSEQLALEVFQRISSGLPEYLQSRVDVFQSLFHSSWTALTTEDNIRTLERDMVLQLLDILTSKYQKLLVLFIDQVDASDTFTKDILTHLLQQLSPRYLIVMTETSTKASSFAQSIQQHVVHVQLTPLCYESVKGLVTSILGDTSIQAEGHWDERHFEAVHRMSRGIPANVKSFCHHIFVAQSSQHQLISGDAAITMLVDYNPTNGNQVDPGAMLTFDQLSYETQVLLKLLSICSCEGYAVSLEMLATLLPIHPLPGLALFSVEDDLQGRVQRLRERILQIEVSYWLKISSSSSTAAGLHIRFRNESLRTLIYEVMVDAFRVQVHHAVAEYLQQHQRITSLQSLEMWYLQGFHWQQAHVWTDAMCCFYEVATMLTSLGAFLDARQQWVQAYAMLDKMKTTMLKSDPSHPSGYEDVEIESMTYAEACTWFCYDQHVIETGLKVMVRLAQSSLSVEMDPLVTKKLFKDALHVFQLFFYQSASGLNISDATIGFSIFSGLLTLYNNVRSIESESEIHRLIEEFIALATTDCAQDDRRLYHLIRAYFFQRDELCAAGKFEEASEILQRAMKLYPQVRQLEHAIEVYGNDRAGNYFAIQLQNYVLKGDLLSIRRCNDFLVKMYGDVTHLTSKAIMVLAWCTALIALHQPRDAWRYVQQYMLLEAASPHAALMFRELSPTICMFTQMEAIAANPNVTEDDEVLFPLSAHQIEGYLQKIKSKIFIDASSSRRSFMARRMDLCGCGVEYLSAKTLFLETLKLYSSRSGAKDVGENVRQSLPTILVNLETVLEYVAYNKAYVAQDLFTLFSYYLIMQLEIDTLLWLLCLFEGEKQYLEDKREKALSWRQQLQQVGKEMLVFGQQYNFPLVLVEVSSLLLQHFQYFLTASNPQDDHQEEVLSLLSFSSPEASQEYGQVLRGTAWKQMQDLYEAHPQDEKESTSWQELVGYYAAVYYYQECKE